MSVENIKLVVLDVDGVLTDGKLLIGSDGKEYKSFNVKDGMGISLAQFHGIKFAIITGRISESVLIRSRELNIDYVYQKVSDKINVLSILIESLGFNLENVCYMGDDLNDLAIINKVGLSFAPNDAVDIVKDSVDYITNSNGGEGAVREALEYIMSRQTDYKQLMLNYIDKKDKIRQ